MSMLPSVLFGSNEFGTAPANIIFLMTLNKQIPEKTINLMKIGVSHFRAASRFARVILRIITSMMVSIVKPMHIRFLFISIS